MRKGSHQCVLECVFRILMIPNDPEYLVLHHGRMPPTQFHECLLISALCGCDQIIIGSFKVTTRLTVTAQARS
jgi:hypothetical protein